MDPFLAEVRIFAGNYAPRGWALCNGQILSISQNTALFSLLGTTYGGDGRSTFALPNLQGAAPLMAGNGPFLSPRNLGEVGGTSTETLTQSTMPSHTHIPMGSSSLGTSVDPTNSSWGAGSVSRGQKLYSQTANVAPMNNQALATSGNSQPHNNLPPYLTLTFIIALQGIFPPRP